MARRRGRRWAIPLVALLAVAALTLRWASGDEGEDPAPPLDVPALVSYSREVFVGRLVGREFDCGGSASYVPYLLVEVERNLLGDAAGLVWVYAFHDDVKGEDGVPRLVEGERHLYFADPFGGKVGTYFIPSTSGAAVVPLDDPEREAALLAEVATAAALAPTPTPAPRAATPSGSPVAC